MKLNRTWTATIDATDGTQVICGYPRTINFQITRGTLVGIPHAVIRIYNLEKHNRQIIFKDQFDNRFYFGITLSAGYEDEPNVPVIFQGNIMSAYNYREGVDWITEINAMDGLYAIQNGQVSDTEPSIETPFSTHSWDAKTIIKKLIQTMPKVNVGAIGNIQISNSRGITLFGNSWSNLLRFTTGFGRVFIDREQVHFLSDLDYIDDGLDAVLVEADTGLLRTPRRQDTRLDIDILFSPEIEVAREIKLVSLEEIYNGFYIVQGIIHRGIISKAVGGEAVTTVTVLRKEKLIYTAIPLPISAFSQLNQEAVA